MVGRRAVVARGVRAMHRALSSAWMPDPIVACSRALEMYDTLSRRAMNASWCPLRGERDSCGASLCCCSLSGVRVGLMQHVPVGRGIITLPLTLSMLARRSTLIRVSFKCLSGLNGRFIRVLSGLNGRGVNGRNMAQLPGRLANDGMSTAPGRFGETLMSSGACRKSPPPRIPHEALALTLSRHEALVLEAETQSLLPVTLKVATPRVLPLASFGTAEIQRGPVRDGLPSGGSRIDSGRDRQHSPQDPQGCFAVLRK